MNASRLGRTVTRPVRRAIRALATTDPDRARLRLATTTITTLVVVGVVLFAGSAATGQAVTAVIPGLILAMIASLAVREPRPGARAATIGLLVPVSVAAVALAALLASAASVVADVVFVAVAAVAVAARALGPRGLVAGLIAFMSYFLALFVHITPTQLPVTAAAEALAAAVTIGIGVLAAPRHPERALRRMISAFGHRCSRVVAALAEAVEDGELDDRLRRTLRSRLSASSATASSVVDALDAEGRPLGRGLGDDDLGVLLLDLQLTIEQLAQSASASLQHPDASATASGFATRLRGFARTLESTQPGLAGPGRERTPADVHPDPSDGRPAALDRLLVAAVDTWLRVTERASAQAAPAAEAVPDRGDEERDDAPADRTDGDRGGDEEHPRRDIARQAVQVAIAAALAIAVGTALSSTRWFWAVITAFVVYTGTASRGDILQKGWLRVGGTLVGVVVGVVVAALVGGDTVLAVALILVCLFCGVYLMAVSSAFMIFFITTMLALLYGLLGQFSVGLLLTRLTETVAGAVIGAAVAFVVLPTSTRDVGRRRMRELLAELAEDVSVATDRLAARRGADVVALDRTRRLRQAFEDFRTAVRPISHGVAGVANRSGTRRTVQTLAVCEYHCRALLRLSDHRSPTPAPSVAELLIAAGEAVRANIESFAAGVGGGLPSAVMRPADRLLDAIESAAGVDEDDPRGVLLAAARELRAIDRAVCGRATELGASER